MKSRFFQIVFASLLFLLFIFDFRASIIGAIERQFAGVNNLKDKITIEEIEEKTKKAIVSIEVIKIMPKQDGKMIVFDFKKFQEDPFSTPFLADLKNVTEKGKGFVFDELGLILTTYHLVGNNVANISIYFENGEKYKAKIIKSDKENDLAILKIEDKDKKFIALDIDNFEFVSDDKIIINNLKETKIIEIDKDSSLLKINYEVEQGNSGLPILNLRGNAIGIINGFDGNFGYAIPANVINDFVKE